MTDLQTAMMLAIFHKNSGFLFGLSTERSLIRRGMIEKRGLLEFRLTELGMEWCMERFGANDES